MRFILIIAMLLVGCGDREEGAQQGDTMTEDQPGDTGIDAGTFRLRDLEFEIDSASIEEDLSESKPRWTLYIGTNERSLFDFRWGPNIRGEDVLVDAPPFSEIVGTTVKVPLAYDHDTDEYLFSMYVFQHDDVFDNSITFLERKDGKFLIHWKGLCHVNWGEEYRRDVPFEFKTWFDIDNSEQDAAMKNKLPASTELKAD